jgi:hypothetical protein
VGIEDVRLALRAQPVDAALLNQLIRQYFLLENRSARLYSIRPKQALFCLNQRSRTTFAAETPGSRLRPGVASTH